MKFGHEDDDDDDDDDVITIFKCMHAQVHIPNKCHIQ